MPILREKRLKIWLKKRMGKGVWLSANEYVRVYHVRPNRLESAEQAEDAPDAGYFLGREWELAACERTFRLDDPLPRSHSHAPLIFHTPLV